MSKSKARGTAFESSLLPLLKKYYSGAERRVTAGANDKGDYILPGAAYALEAKNCARVTLAEWIKEAQKEAKNLGVPHGVVVHKRVRHGQPEDQWVTLTLHSFLELVAGSDSPACTCSHRPLA